MRATTVLLCGVGGQGTVLAADLLARAALQAGYQVKVSEIHGMAQRGGAVTTVVRYGDAVNTMVADIGDADCIVSFETTEALRNIAYLKEGGFLLVADETIKPLPVACGAATMPHDVKARLDAFGAILFPARDLALQAGNAKCENVAILGGLEARLGFGAGIWKGVIEGRVPPKTVEANLKAFDLGLTFAHGR
ncbi:MAG TPA: pyruvate ferredoxin oxidoreductase [Eggerthellaceae bacterium]|nr:pyruvate ferredoxin oxidoreductase [Eggerthellaceae bacterium]